MAEIMTTADALEKLRTSEQEYGVAKIALDTARREFRKISKNQYLEFLITRSRSIQESTTVVVESLEHESPDRVEARLRSWLDHDRGIDELPWEFDDEDATLPEVSGFEGVVADFDAGYVTVTVPLNDD